MRHLLRFLPLVPLFLFAGCGSSGGGSAGSGAGGTPAPTAGSVLVVIDTATGSEALVQFQIDAAALEYDDGSTTPNLLANPHMVTLADPSGEADGLVLQSAPNGSFAALRLLLVPASGASLQADGTILPASSTVDLRVPITDGLTHDSLATSSLLIGHNGTPPPAGAGAVWSPQLSARAVGSGVELGYLGVAVVQSPAVTTRCGALDDSALRVEFAANCSYTSDDGSVHAGRDDFLASLGDDSLHARGELRRDGSLLATHVHRGGRNDNPRLIGRITALEPATGTFVMDVLAETRRGRRTILTTPFAVRIDASNAQLRRPDSRVSLTFAELQVGNLAKVQWTSRSTVPGDLERIVAREVEVASSAVGMQPEWEGRVQSVDLGANTITVVPRNNDPIFVQGVSVASVQLTVAAGTFLQRRERHGGGRTVITLADIVPGSDRIWWRGTATGPASIDANWVRVREE
jgi:hypothetical protein